MLSYKQYWDIEKFLKYFIARDIRLFSRTPRKLYLKINQGVNFSTLQRKLHNKKSPDWKLSSGTA